MLPKHMCLVLTGTATINGEMARNPRPSWRNSAEKTASHPQSTERRRSKFSTKSIKFPTRLFQKVCTSFSKYNIYFYQCMQSVITITFMLSLSLGDRRTDKIIKKKIVCFFIFALDLKANYARKSISCQLAPYKNVLYGISHIWQILINI